VNVTSPTNAASKWVSRAQAGAQQYGASVASSTVDQAGLAAAAEPTWAAGVANAAANHFFSDGVQKAGTAAWKAGVANKGVARYSPGVTNAQTKYTANVTPYINALQGLTLPARGPKGSNIQRVQAVDDLMQATRKQNA